MYLPSPQIKKNRELQFAGWTLPATAAQWSQRRQGVSSRLNSLGHLQAAHDTGHFVTPAAVDGIVILSAFF